VVVAAVAVVGLALRSVLCLAPASPAAASVRDPSQCSLLPIRASFVWGDPVGWYPGIGGLYENAQGVAYKITAQFPHATPQG
jgi:hypothetical protein